MNTESSRKLARRFIELPIEKRRLFLQGLQAEGVDFSLFPIPANVLGVERDELSYAQQRMWFLWQLDPGSAAYNLPMAVRLDGHLDIASLQYAFDGLVARHEALRTLFVERSGEVQQQVVDPFAVSIATLDLSDISADQQPARVRQLADAEALAPFDLATGPLLRVQLLRLAEYEHVMLLTLHHIVADGWSMNVLIEEFARLYDTASEAGDAGLPCLPIQYRDYALWQRSWMEAGERDRQLDYWRQQLGNDHAPLDLPLDYPRPLTPSYRGARHQLRVDSDLAQRLREFAKGQGVTLFTVLLSAFKVLLHRYSGQPIVRVGIPVANRNREEVEGLIGCFINTQVLHSQIDPLADVLALLRQVKDVALGAQGHQELPFEGLVEALGLDRSVNHSPLFQVMYNHQAHVADVHTITVRGGLNVSALPREIRIAQFDLTLDTWEKADGVYAAFGYALDLFSRATIERMGEHWLNLLKAFVSHPEQAIAHLPMMADEEHQRVVAQWSVTHTCSPSTQCLRTLFEAQVLCTPDAIAVVCAERTLTYRQLNRQANQLACKLSGQGVGPNILVGIAVERSLEMMVGLLAILKAGGAYVPLDPEYPQDRLAYMIEDSKACLLLTQAHLRARLGEHTPCLLIDIDEALQGNADDNPLQPRHPGDLLYVIYTSGSTGRPKGAAVRNGSFVNLLTWYMANCNLTCEDRVLLVSSYSFDLTQKNLFGVLCVGGQLVLPATAYEPLTLGRDIAKYQITLINCAPSAFYPLLHADHAALTSLRHVLLGGEPIAVAELSQWLSGTCNPLLRIHNTYGPTECTDVVIASGYPRLVVLEKTGLSLGRPVPGCQVHVLDSLGEPVPVGVSGEIHVGGSCVGEGYWHRPALTAERFVPDPFAADGTRAYRTGDLACYLSDGVIEYIGRADQQVKIRGVRIELEEIEKRLRGVTSVREAVVVDVPGPDGDKQLAAYIVAVDGNAARSLEDASQLRSVIRTHLKAALPEFMIPSHLIVLEQLPLTPNGKLDRRALPAPQSLPAQSIFRPPVTPMQQQLAAAWSHVLKVEKIGLDDDFFALGGHSLLATQMIMRLRDQHQIELPLRVLFECPVLHELAEQISLAQQSSTPLHDELAKSLEALKRLTTEEIDELIS